MSNFYEQLCESFIKPARQTYHRHDLGQAMNAHGKRTDFQITNKRKLKLVCSFYTNNINNAAPCVVYLHGFNGSRLESLVYVDRVLATGMNMCVFDFSGTGLSEGQYVSLGAHEQFDVLDVLDHVTRHFSMKKYILWGRSMGAAAAIKSSSLVYSKRFKQNSNYQIDYELIGLILDSPFHSLNQLSIQIAKSKVKIPQILIKAVLALVKSTIQSKASFNMNDLELLPDASQIKCPVLLIASKQDQLINYSHADKIYKAILHKEKQILFIKGEHYDMREKKVVQYILKFIENAVTKTEGLGKKQTNGADSKKGLRYISPFLEKNHHNQNIFSKESLPKKNFMYNSIQTESPNNYNHYIKRMRTDESYEQDKGSKKSISDILNVNSFQNKISSVRNREGEKIANKYKKSYFNIQPTPQFGTPNKLKLKSKKHIQSQQILETKHFFSDKKIDEKQPLQKQQTEQFYSPSKKILDLKNNKQRTLTQNQKNYRSQKTDKVMEISSKGQQEIKKQKIRLLNPNIRLLSNSVEYLDCNTAEQTSPNKQIQEKITISPQIEVNHFNVINSKLNKNRKKKIPVSNHESDQFRHSSVQRDRKSLLNAKKPPSLQRNLKIIHENSTLGITKSYILQKGLPCQ